VRRFIVFLILFTVWLVFSGHFDVIHLALGVTCSALVALFSYDLLFPEAPSYRTAAIAWRVLCFFPWLFYQIVLSNLHILYLVCRPDRLRPQIVHFKTILTSDLAKVAFGTSITLTPGTVTMDIINDEFTVHAISDQAAKSLRSGKMERRVGHAFMESINQVIPGGAPPATEKNEVPS